MKNADPKFPNPRGGIAVETVCIALMVLTVILIALVATS